MEENSFEKLIWDDSDFEQMSWHDNKVYAIAFNDKNFELLFDIDYIVQWVDPPIGDRYYKFYVAPSTLIFKNVYDISFDLCSLDLIIEEISRSPSIEPHVPVDKDKHDYVWRIQTTAGEISFKSVGYRQVLRQNPILIDQQTIGLLERGSWSFEIPDIG